jgi:hypothetical protein
MIESASPLPTSSAAESGLPSATTTPVPPVLPPAAPGKEGNIPARQTLEAKQRPERGAATSWRGR